MEMVDGEPPFFNEPPLQAMRRIRDMPPPKLKNPQKVSPFSIWSIFKDFAQNSIARNTIFDQNYKLLRRYM